MRVGWYFLPHLLWGVEAVSLWLGGLWTWSLPVIVFGVIPVAEQFFAGSSTPYTEAEEVARRANPWFDVAIYSLVAGHVAVLAWFLIQVQAGAWTGASAAGALFTVGIACGSFGINLGHELGHRRSAWPRRVARLALGTSLYAHFFVEHNRGHHVRVATDDDPASARRGEVLYAFWLRSLLGSFASAWRLETQRLARSGAGPWSVRNEVLVGVLLELGLVLGLAVFVGGYSALAMVVVGLVGALLLETVNYVEHYGLRRQRLPDGRWEPVKPFHSWNSNRPLSRALLFELPRHSDHHHRAARPYPILQPGQDVPELPAGYAGMVLLALCPPMFFRATEPLLDGLPRRAAVVDPA